MIRGIKFRILFKKSKIQKPNLNSGFRVDVSLSVFQAVKRTTEIAEGTLHPVVLVNDLHFQVDNGTVIQQNLDIQKKVLADNRIAKLNWICDDNGANLRGIKVKQGTNEPLEHPVIALEQSPEQVVIVHTNGDGA